MTEKDKEELAHIVRTVLNEERKQPYCSLGIKPETAHELIRFADDYKQARRTFNKVLISVAGLGLLYALWEGIKVYFRK